MERIGFASVEAGSPVERRRELRQQLADGLIPIEEFMRAIEETYPESLPEVSRASHNS
jgi:hypothetical protein